MGSCLIDGRTRNLTVAVRAKVARKVLRICRSGLRPPPVVQATEHDLDLSGAPVTLLTWPSVVQNFGGRTLASVARATWCSTQLWSARPIAKPDCSSYPRRVGRLNQAGKPPQAEQWVLTLRRAPSRLSAVSMATLSDREGPLHRGCQSRISMCRPVAFWQLRHLPLRSCRPRALSVSIRFGQGRDRRFQRRPGG